MIISYLSQNWKLIVDYFVFSVLLGISLYAGMLLGMKFYLFLRTRFFWEPKVGDRVVVHALRRNATLIRIGELTLKASGHEKCKNRKPLLVVQLPETSRE